MSANQNYWAKLLDVAEFSYNIQMSETTDKSPFEIVMGQQPLTPPTLTREYMGTSAISLQIY